MISTDVLCTQVTAVSSPLSCYHADIVGAALVNQDNVDPRGCFWEIFYVRIWLR